MKNSKRNVSKKKVSQKKKSTHGGVVNKTLGKDNFDSIVKMLGHSGCEITHISYSSLKGFVFKVHINNIPEQDVEFYGLNENTNIFETPIDTLVIKLALLYTGVQTEEKALELPNYQENNNERRALDKQMEFFADFENEAIIQSEVYEKTLSKGHPICPALIDFSHFTSMDASMPFLDILESKCSSDDEAKSMIKYLKSIITSVRDCQLGIITMESALAYDSFYNMYDSYGSIDPATLSITGTGTTKPTKSQVLLCNDVIVQIIRLLNECRIVHCDLHGENVMVKKTGDSSPHKIFIIDFGRILHIDRLSGYEKKVTEKYAKDLFMTRNFFEFTSSPELKLSSVIKTNLTNFDKNFLKTILHFIMAVDFMYNKTRFDRDSQSKIQKNYINNIDRLTSYTAITGALNNYYALEVKCTIEEMVKYKRVKPNQQYNKDVTRFETLCDRLKETKGSPGKYKFIARDAPELYRKKKAPRTQKIANSPISFRSTRNSRSGSELNLNRGVLELGSPGSGSDFSLPRGMIQLGTPESMSDSKNDSPMIISNSRSDGTSKSKESSNSFAGVANRFDFGSSDKSFVSMKDKNENSSTSK